MFAFTGLNALYTITASMAFLAMARYSWLRMRTSQRYVCLVLDVVVATESGAGVTVGRRGIEWDVSLQIINE